VIEHFVFGKVGYRNFTTREKIVYWLILSSFTILVWFLIVLKVQGQIKSYYPQVNSNLESVSLVFINNRFVKRKISPKIFIEIFKQLPPKSGVNVYTLIPKLKLKFECVIDRKKINILVYQYYDQADTYTIAMEYANTFYLDTFFNFIKTLDVATISQSQFEQFQNL